LPREALHGRDQGLGQGEGLRETLFGRRIYLPEINGGNGPRKSGAERQAINAPMQGTAADLIKLAMVAAQDLIDHEKRATKMIMQVHDELVFEVPDAEIAWAREAVPRVMASVAQPEGAAARRGGRGAELGPGALSRHGSSAVTTLSQKLHRLRR